MNRKWKAALVALGFILAGSALAGSNNPSEDLRLRMLLSVAAPGLVPMAGPRGYRAVAGTSLVVADSSGRKPLSLEDLGFSKEETRSDPQFQKDLNARSDMLHIHQILGLVTAVPMVATYIMGLEADDDSGGGGGEGESEGSAKHAAFGITTAVLYATTASFAIFAPKPKGTKESGNTGIHRILAFIHVPLMIITPILGAQLQSGGEDDGGLKDLHFVCATALVASYLTSMAIVTF